MMIELKPLFKVFFVGRLYFLKLVSQNRRQNWYTDVQNWPRLTPGCCEYTTTTSVLMPLSRLAGVDKICFNLLSSPISIYASSLFKPYGFRSFFTHSSHDFLGRLFFLFQVIINSITSRI